MKRNSQLITLYGTRNTRELGGYRTDCGLFIKTHVLLRSDALQKLTREDGAFLNRYGLRCVIDLRSQDEINRAPDKLEVLGDFIQYKHVDLQKPVQKKRYAEAFPPSLWELYCWMLDDCQAEFRTIFETILHFPEDCVLFHCTGGKDRTGMVAMLLLKLAGVEDKTIVEDYALTEALMKDLFVLQTRDLESRGLTVPQYIMQSPPENMRKALNHLSLQYGTAEEYLVQIGLNESDIPLLKNKMLK